MPEPGGKTQEVKFRLLNAMLVHQGGHDPGQDRLSVKREISKKTQSKSGRTPMKKKRVASKSENWF